MSPSPMQLLIVAFVIMLLFGGKRLGELGKGLGAGIRNFKLGVSGEEADEADQAKAGRTQQLRDPESPVNR